MRYDELLKSLGRLSVETGSLACLGCGYEHNCGVQGCAILRAERETILRPVSREQVEKVWKGEWILKRQVYEADECICSRCMSLLTTSHGERKPFCPTCSSANTDEAVEMVMERVEAIFSARNDD